MTGRTDRPARRYSKKVSDFLLIASLKSLAHSVYVTAIEQKGEEIRFTMYEKAKIDPSSIP